jgi:site-specific DNA-methyltransferase (adenine-specific)
MINFTENTDKYINRIINGNSKEVLKNFDSNSIDLVVTSPPYDDLRNYTNDEHWNFKLFQEIARQLFRVMKMGGVVVWVVGDKVTNGNKSLTSYRQALYFQEIGFNIFDVIIYEKAGSGPPHKNRYFNTYEYMFVLSKGLPKTINLLKDKANKWANCKTYGNVTRREKDGSLTDKGRKTVNEFGVRTNIWKYTNGKGFSTQDEIAYQHPAIFPEKLVQDHILSWSNEGDVVLDPFSGSGTVAKVAIQLKRNWISIEISEEYCKLAEKRIKQISCNTEL